MSLFVYYTFYYKFFKEKLWQVYTNSFVVWGHHFQERRCTFSALIYDNCNYKMVFVEDM